MAAAGVDLLALRELIGHASPETPASYVTLASPTLRTAYDQAIGKMRRRLILTPIGKPIIPEMVSGLSSEMLGTRLPHGLLLRPLRNRRSPYEACDNFVTGPEFHDALSHQLTDVQNLRADAQARGWGSEAARHARVAEALTDHLARLPR